MATALIFAGGVGERMSSKARPKQFLEIHGKPILIYTIECFEHHPDIEDICVVCLKKYIPELKSMLERYFIKKVKWIVSGGETGHDSIYNGLKAVKGDSRKDTIIMIHDGVRPLLAEELISENIEVTKSKGNAITVSSATESLAQVDKDGVIVHIPDRKNMTLVRAPQTFYFGDIWDAHQWALKEGIKAVDSADLMHRYGILLHTVEGNTYNIKITSPSDYYIFRAIYDAIENLQIFGL